MLNLEKAIAVDRKRSSLRAILTFQLGRAEDAADHTLAFTEYLPIAKTLKMFSGGSELAQLLGELQEEDFAANQGMISSLVVRKDTGMPGVGYFEHARTKLKCNIDRTPLAEYNFWVGELAKLGLTTRIPAPQA